MSHITTPLPPLPAAMEKVLGCDSELFQLETEVLESISKNQDVTQILSEDKWGSYRPFSHSGEIPKCVTDQWTFVNTISLEEGVHPGFPKQVWTKKVKHQKNKQPLDVSSMIAKLKSSKLLFRGLSQQSLCNDILFNGFTVSTSMENEFGHGLYTTPNLEYALEYVRGHGTLLIFDWSDGGGEVITNHLVGELWSRTVKGFTCFQRGNAPRPPRHTGDVLCGAVSGNHQNVLNCNQPLPSNFIQYVAKTPDGCSAFQKRLIAIVYFYR